MIQIHPFDPRAAQKRGRSRLFAFFMVCALLLLIAQPAFAGSSGQQPPPSAAMLEKISKRASQQALLPGETVTYTIHLENTWCAEYRADVKDPLPAGLEYVPGSASHGGVYDAAGRTLAWTDIAVVSGAAVDLKFAMKYVEPVIRPTPLVNVAYISWGGFMMRRPAWVTLLPEAAGDLGLRPSFKSAEPRVLADGEQVTYTIHLINKGAAAATVQVVDPLPVPLGYVAGSANAGGVYDAAARTLTWKDVLVPPYNPLLPVEPVKLTFAARAPSVLPASIRPQLVTNTAAISDGQVTLLRSTDILLTHRPYSALGGSFKSASQREVAPGDVYSYAIVLNNSSTDPVSAVVKDPLPTQVSYVDGSANAGGVYDETTRTLSWENLTVPEGSSLELSFEVKALSLTTANSLRIRNTASISSGALTLKRSVTVLLSPNPGGDLRPPRVDSLTIDKQDVLEQPGVRLHIAASDNVGVTQMFIKEWVLSTKSAPRWEEVQSSGWVPYQADAPWTLTSQSGTHFVGVWVADAAMNKSRLTRAAVDFASLVLPGATLAENGLQPYLVYYPAGVDVKADLTVLSGAARLFAWFPGNLFAPDHSGPASGAQSISFTTRTAGVYLFLVYASTPASYDLAIKPAGGPRVPLNSVPWPPAASSAADLSFEGTSTLDSLDVNPILPQSGLDPLDSAAEPNGPYHQVFLPGLQR